MAYDPSTGQLILFGGQGVGGELNDTWNWNLNCPINLNWTQLLPTTSPSPRISQAMAYDPATGQFILFGGWYLTQQEFLGDTWNWNGSTWTQVASTGPDARVFAAMAYDPVNKQLLLFGGVDANNSYLSDTWVWNGTAWTLLSPPNSPPGRSDAAMALDPVTGQLILFGGTNGTIALNDTWTWDGTTWNPLSPANSPSPRLDAAMDFDSATGQLILFGGFNTVPGTGVFYNDTWTWDGTNWNPLSPTTSPSPRVPTMAFSPASGQLLIFGGSIPYGYSNETWSWDGNANTWTQLTSANSPSVREYNTLAFDYATGQLILFGGLNNIGTGALNDTWSWGFSINPTVTSISPMQGPLSGNTQVTISGTNFCDVESVNFGSVPGNIISNTENQIVVQSPATLTAGTVNVTVTSATGTSALSSGDKFTYVSLPTVTGISPSKGSIPGGTSVTLTGTALTGATAVNFGSLPASITSNSATQIVAVSPVTHVAGTVDVTVTTVGGTSAISPADQFTYLSTPTVTGISPNKGPLQGGTSVTLTGTGLAGATAVNFGNIPGSITFNSATQITATSPAHIAGTVDVTVTTAGGTSAPSLFDKFTYVAAPTVSGISPSKGSTNGGTSVVITGTGFTGAIGLPAVHFGSLSATNVTVNSDTQITAKSPAQSAKTVDVTVTTAGGTSATSRKDQFTYSK